MTLHGSRLHSLRTGLGCDAAWKQIALFKVGIRVRRCMEAASTVKVGVEAGSIVRVGVRATQN